MTTLCELGKKYNTDKYPWYTPLYDMLLNTREVYDVLEIGIGTVPTMGHVEGYVPGASLRMWKDYFGEGTRVWSFDIDPAVVLSAKDETNGIHTCVCDQSDRNMLRFCAAHAGGAFDLILDDGSHDPKHQALGVEVLWQFLNPGGLYIIEDVNNFEEVSPLLRQPHVCLTTYYGKLMGRVIVIQKEQ